MSLGFFLRSLPAGSLVAGVSPSSFLAARPGFVSGWAIRVLWAEDRRSAAFQFVAGQQFGFFPVIVAPGLPSPAAQPQGVAV